MNSHGGMVVPAERPTSPASFHCEVGRAIEDIHALAGEWEGLQRAGGRDSQCFQTLQWNRAWLRTFLEEQPDAGHRFQPCVLLVRRANDGMPVLVWPLARESYPLGLKAISWMSDPFAQYGDVMTILRGAELDAALRTALLALRDMDADLVRLRYVRADAVVAPFLQRRLCKSHEDCAAPWLDFSPFSGVEDLQRRFSREQRRRRRRIARKLRQHLGGELRMRLMEGAAEMKVAIGAILDCKRRWLRQKGLVSRALFDGQTERFLLSLVEEMAPPGRTGADAPELVITVLEAGEQQLSWEIGFRYRGRHYAYITAHLPELTDFSIGRLHMDMAQQQALRDGVKVFDLLVPDAPHKRTWSSHKTPVSSYYLPLTARGRLLGAAYLDHLRPLARRIYHHMPPQMRRLLRISDVVEHEIAG